MPLFNRIRKVSLPRSGETLPGRALPLQPAGTHFLTGRSLAGPYPSDARIAMFGMGCFWGVERLYWELPGIWTTAVGYAGGRTPNPTYREVCTGMTGHNEVVRVVFHPSAISFESLLRVFWENHDPTQGMRQGNDIGTQYRSGIYTYGQTQLDSATESRDIYGGLLAKKGLGQVTTEIVDAPEFYFAEDYHQQYLAKNPGGYCNIRGIGVRMETA